MLSLLARRADDTPFKYKRNEDGTRVPPMPGGPKTEMAFLTVKEKDKEKTDKLAGKWSDQMMTAGIAVRGYTIEDNRILFVCDERGYRDMTKARNYLLRQPEVVEFEWSNRKSKPGDAPMDENAEPPPDPLAKFQAMQEEQMAIAKRKERAAKKAAREAEKQRKIEELRRKKEENEKKKKAQEAAAPHGEQAPEPKTEL